MGPLSASALLGSSAVDWIGRREAGEGDPVGLHEVAPPELKLSPGAQSVRRGDRQSG